MIVGHVPLTLSRTFHLFLKHGGKISVEVTGKEETKASAWKFRPPTDLSTRSRLKCQSLCPQLKIRKTCQHAEALHVFVKTGIMQAVNSTLHSNLSFLLTASDRAKYL